VLYPLEPYFMRPEERGQPGGLGDDIFFGQPADERNMGLEEGGVEYLSLSRAIRPLSLLRTSPEGISQMEYLFLMR
jgi:hypothetical protein